MATKPIRVLVVDDSAFARKVIREVLSSDPAIEVIGIARDGLEALEKIAELKPDVVTLDLVMPELDGIGVLKALPRDTGARVVIVSVSGSESEIAIEALEAGALDLVSKPTPLPTDRLYNLAQELIEKVKAAAQARPNFFQTSGRVDTQVASQIEEALDFKHRPPGAIKLVAIGTSTGGPHALSRLFEGLPAGLPATIAIALHIPAGYTEALAARLSQLGGVPVTEAYDGQELMAGHAVIAPGGMHLRVEESGGKFYAAVSREPAQHMYHPSVDILFESTAKAAGSAALALIMTGMGDDGLLGAKKVKSAGGIVIAESAASCVVYGMPRSVIEAGLSDGEVPIERMPKLLLDYLYKHQL